jgi:hypothetical protein
VGIGETMDLKFQSINGTTISISVLVLILGCENVYIEDPSYLWRLVVLALPSKLN